MSELNRVTWWTAIAAVAVAVFGATLEGCGAAKTPPANSQALAQNVVQTAAEAWNLAARACLQAAGVDFDAETVENPALARECLAVLQPMHDGIVTAQVAVNVWDSAAQRDFPCLLTQIGKGFGEAVALFPGLPTQVADAAHVLALSGGVCSDGGK